MKRPQKLLLISILLAMASWVVPVLSLITLPLQYLYTDLHEMGHAIMALATGASGITIQVFANGSGVTESYGGWILFVSPAGYVGATILGSIVLYLARTEKGARIALAGLAVFLLLGLALWIRGDIVGLSIAIAYVATLFLAARRLKGDALAITGQFVGAYLCLASLQAVLSIFGFGSVAMQENDAQILEAATHIPAALSATLWAGLSLASVLLFLRRAWKSE